MAVDPIASRYAQALFETAQAEGTLDEALEQLEALGALIASHPPLRQLFLNPDVDPDDKVGLLDRVLHSSWSALVRAFVTMVVAMGRAEALPEIAEALRALADEAHQRLRVTVRSAHPVPAPLLARLRAALERREGKTITLKTQLDPALLGGVQVRLDHRVIDGTVRRQLIELRERLTTTKVV